MTTESYPNVTDFALMPYARSERMDKFRKLHKYKLIKQEGNSVEYEFEYCSDKNCSCHDKNYSEQ